MNNYKFTDRFYYSLVPALLMVDINISLVKPSMPDAYHTIEMWGVGGHINITSFELNTI